MVSYWFLSYSKWQSIKKGGREKVSGREGMKKRGGKRKRKEKKRESKLLELNIFGA